MVLGPMRKTVLALLLLLLGACPTFAKGPQGVNRTFHNLSADAINFPFGWNTYNTGEDEVCIFCHTPHGGDNIAPLWNRSNPVATNFTHYNSATLSNVLQGLNTGRAIGDESLLCMSCHDGSVALNRLLNNSNDTGAPVGATTEIIGEIFPGGPRNFSRIGGGSSDPVTGTGDLSDDHPISFSYWDVWNEDTTKLHDPATFTGVGDEPRFFPLGGAQGPGGMRVECSSCHDPHVNYDSNIPGPGADPQADESYRPFLIMANTGSALCLACHIK